MLQRWRRRVCEDPDSGDPAGSAADQSDTPEGKSHRTEWQHRTPETEEITNQVGHNTLKETSALIQ